MKTILFALALISTGAQAAVEAPSGCVWQKDHGACIVTNETLTPLFCDVTTNVEYLQTMGGWARTRNTITKTKLSIPPKMSDHTVKIQATDSQKITGIQVVAVCKAQ